MVGDLWFDTSVFTFSKATKDVIDHLVVYG